MAGKSRDVCMMYSFVSIRPLTGDMQQGIIGVRGILILVSIIRRCVSNEVAVCNHVEAQSGDVLDLATGRMMSDSQQTEAVDARLVLCIFWPLDSKPPSRSPSWFVAGAS